MNKRHKWADVLIAIAEGRPVQCWSNCNDDWLDCTVTENVNPLTKPYHEWRVKPEKKIGWINIYYPDSEDEMFRPSAYIYPTQEEAIAKASRIDRIACIQIEYEEGQGLS